MSQLKLAFHPPVSSLTDLNYREKLLFLLKGDLDFHGQDSSYASHAWHSFPAKFPPQLPRRFILELTRPGDVVFDPMMGSGTTLVEAVLNGRQAVGVDIDPLALHISAAKLMAIDAIETYSAGRAVLEKAKRRLINSRSEVESLLKVRFDTTTRKFVDYWFAPQIQLELMALIEQIESLDDSSVRAFLSLVFSAIIITKSGGVSLARDLAHTRPHRDLEKKKKSVFEEFDNRLQKNLKNLDNPDRAEFLVCQGDAQSLPLRDNSVDLIVTSPPYASHAIDYMRAHKFSLVWLGYNIDTLGEIRRDYVGGDALNNEQFLSLPNHSASIVRKIAERDPKKSKVLHRYYSESSRFLSEMYRILKPGRAAIVVVGTSTMRGINTETHICLGEIGEQHGFELCHIGVRRLDRDKRMMPARWGGQNGSQIEARMHEEYVIGFLKPENNSI